MADVDTMIDDGPWQEVQTRADQLKVKEARRAERVKLVKAEREAAKKAQEAKEVKEVKATKVILDKKVKVDKPNKPNKCFDCQADRLRDSYGWFCLCKEKTTGNCETCKEVVRSSRKWCRTCTNAYRAKRAAANWLGKAEQLPADVKILDGKSKSLRKPKKFQQRETRRDPSVCYKCERVLNAERYCDVCDKDRAEECEFSADCKILTTNRHRGAGYYCTQHWKEVEPYLV